MSKTADELQKNIELFDRDITKGKKAELKRRAAMKELRKVTEKAYRDRLYDIGRLVFDLGWDELDDEVLAGILTRGAEVLAAGPTAREAFHSLGKEAITECRRRVKLEVRFSDRPDRSASAIMREAKIKPAGSVMEDGRRWAIYRGQGKVRYLERRLQGTGAVIQPATS